MKIFLTGGSGFVGGHTAEALRETHDVLAMARSEASAATVRAYGATPVTCSLGEVRPEHLTGVDAVIHAAARVEDWGTRAEFWAANVDGTRQLLEAARAAGVRRFIHIGTEAAIFDGHDLIDVDERAPYPARHRFPYSETKAEAERLVLAADAADFTAISLRPRLIWGPRDHSVLPAIVHMARSGAFAWIDRGRQRTSTCHVFNLVHAITLALTAGTGGRAYFIADAEVSTARDFLSRLAATRGVDLGRRSIPGAIARPIARVVEAVWARTRGGKPPMSAFAVTMLSRTVTVDTRRAREELGYRPVISVEEGLSGLQAETETS